VHSFHLYKKYAIFLLAFLLFWIADSVRGTAHASLSLDDERKLGKEFYDKLFKENLISPNERARTYLTRLGQLILAHSDKAPFDFTFSLIKSSAVNAFATPGGYVYVNEGLVTLVENESQLAGVLAHEIAHVNGRHIAEIIDKSQKLSISTLAAILAGAFLGGSSDAAAAVTSFSVAAATSLSLKYSRQQEEAADRAGMSYLVEAGYHGSGMLEFLKIMRRYEYYSNTIPSYFLTHPGTDERTRYIDALLQTTYTSQGAESIIGNLKRIQTVLLLEGKVPDSIKLLNFQKILKENPRDVDALYGLAVAQEKQGMVNDSLETFRKVLQLSPDDPDILRDFGITYFNIGRFEDASLPLTHAHQIDESDMKTVLYLGKALESLGNIPKALELYRKYEEKQIDDPDFFYNLAMAYGKVNQTGDSHYYFGMYFKKKGKNDSAIFHFSAALKHFDANTPRSREISKEIDALKRSNKTPLVNESRHR